MIFALIITLLLRIPSFFEPYWYGDEGIYLAIGQAMQRGAMLYRDIWDNKPPLLYMIYALQPTLLWAKISATLCVLGTVLVVYKITKNNLAAILTGTFLSLPILEGTVANAELYFTLPIVITAWLFLKDKINPWIMGLLFSIAFLIKIPAVFDFLGLFLAWFLINRKLKPLFVISLIPLISLIFLIVYFYLNQALPDFLIASFSQNASYVAVGSGPLSRLSNPLFIKAVLLLFSLFALYALFLKKKLSKELLLLTFWFGFSIYGALLSNRPYLHYLLQIVPPAVILLFYLQKFLLFPYILVLVMVAKMFLGGFALETKGYYANWYGYMTEQKTWKDYINYFDSRTSNNYAIGKYLATRTSSLEPIFVWGDNAFVYVLANRPPATKFIQAHHLTTVDSKNYELVMQKLKETKPKFIIISRPIHFAFPALEDLVKKDYKFTATFLDLYVYQKK